MNDMRLALIFAFIFIYSSFRARSCEVEVFACRPFSQELSKSIVTSMSREDDDPIAIKIYIIGKSLYDHKFADLTFRGFYEDSLNVQLESEPFFGRGVDYLVVENKKDWYHVFLEMDPRNDQTSGKRIRISKVLNVYESKLFAAEFEFGVSKNDHLLSIFRKIE